MSSSQDQTVYLAAVYTAAVQVQKLANTGQVDEEVMECLIHSLLAVNPPTALAAYGDTDRLLKSGYQLMSNILNKKTHDDAEAINYSLMLIMLERKVISDDTMMQTISTRLSDIQTKVGNYGALHDFVINACGKLYEDTVSQCKPRIMIADKFQILQRGGNPAKARTLLLAGIRAAMQWQYSGGRRWRLLLLKNQVLFPALARLEYIKRGL